ncbi:MAG: hypothetical protein ACLS8R_09870, partial [Anaeromassilibacillus sp.]
AFACAAPLFGGCADEKAGSLSTSDTAGASSGFAEACSIVKIKTVLTAAVVTAAATKAPTERKNIFTLDFLFLIDCFIP